MKNLYRLSIYIIILLNLISFKSFAQIKEWVWAKSVGGSGLEVNFSSAIDKEGNLFVAGYFMSPIIKVGSTTLTNNSDEPDGYIVKYDKNGGIIWAKSLGGDKDDRIRSIATDDSGNIYVAGSFTSFSLEVGTLTLQNTRSNPDSLSSGDLFLIKYDSNGNAIWAKSARGYDYENILNITVDKNSNIYITGVSDSPSVTFGTETLSNTGGFDVFLVKYDSNGNVVFAKNFGGIYYEFSTGIALDDKGNIYISGFFSSPQIAFGSDTLRCIGAEDVFIAKHDSNGNMIWVKSFGGFGADRSNALTISKNGDFYITGYFHNSIQIGTNILENSGNSPTIFTAKFDSEADVLWAKSSDGNIDSLSGENLTLDAEGNIYVTGGFVSQTITFGTKTLNSHGSSDIFIVKYNPDGEVTWAESIGGSEFDYATNIIIDMSNNIYIAGMFGSPSMSVGVDTVRTVGGMDALIAKYGFKTTSVLEEVNNYVNIFPNPTASQFHISNLEPGNWTITIYTLDGQPVFKKEITEADAMIDLSGKAKGAYVYRLLNDGEVLKTGKIVLE